MSEWWANDDGSSSMKASGVNVQNCTIQKLDPNGVAWARSYTVWVTQGRVTPDNPNPQWVALGDINALVDGQQCSSDAPVPGTIASVQFHVAGEWTVRTIMTRVNDADTVPASCGSGDPNDPDCAGSRADHVYTADVGSAMDLIVEDDAANVK
jgi:hypothetical protein